MVYYYHVCSQKHFNYKNIMIKILQKNKEWQLTKSKDRADFSFCYGIGKVLDYRNGWYKLKDYFAQKLAFKEYYPACVIIKKGVVHYPRGKDWEGYIGVKKWYFKPIGNSGGNGIVILKSVEEGVKEAHGRKGHTYVMQSALDNIHLYHGKKYDIRMYVMMRVDKRNGKVDCFLFRDGYCRICINKFKLHYVRDGNITNVSANWKEGAYLPERNIKLLSEFKHYPLVFERISSMIIDVLETMFDDFQPRFKNNNGFHGFVFMGFDIILDKELMPHIIEVNNMMGYKMYGKHRGYTQMHNQMFEGIIKEIIQPLVNNNIDHIDVKNDANGCNDCGNSGKNVWKYLNTFTM